MILRFFLADRAFLDQDFDMTVVAGSSQYAVAAYLVNTAVADVRPERPAFLHEADGTSRARAKIDGNVGTECDDFIVRPGITPYTESPADRRSVAVAAMNKSCTTCKPTSAAFAPSEWPPMPSKTSSNAASSDTTTAARSWLSWRSPRALTFAYSIFILVLVVAFSCEQSLE